MASTSVFARPALARKGPALLAAIALLSLLAVLPKGSPVGASGTEACAYLAINTSAGPEQFTPLPSVWNWVATFEANPGGVPWYTHESLDDDEVEAAQRALQTWEDLTDVIDFTYMGSTSARPVDPATFGGSRDGFNVIGPDTLANGSFILPDDQGLGIGLFTGSALDAFHFDVAINFNADGGGVRVPDEGETEFHDFESIVLHEMGHVLGLDHMDKPGGQVMATKLERGTTNQSPQSLDLSCMQQLYGAPTTCGGLDVTVNLAAGQSPTAGPDVILGTAGADVILAGGGDDVICGGGGNDRLYGQAGNDTIYGDDGNDFIRGSDGNDELRGGAGADDLAGGRGDDRVYGESGDDTKVRGGTGDDFIDGGDGDEGLIAGNGGSDQVYGGPGNDAKITGGPRPDSLYGGPGNDLLQGFGGADDLFGEDGNDDLRGGRQADELDGGDGTDICNGGSTGNGALEFDSVSASCETLVNIP